MDRLQISGLWAGYGNRNVLEEVSLRVEPGAFVGILGPNGSGKSTLLKTLYAGIRPVRGTIELDGTNLDALSRKAIARKMAVVGQENAIPFNFRAREIVAMGRTPHKCLFEPDTLQDRKAVQSAMELLGVADLADRDFSQLSGGEKQRVLIARAFAQEAEFLVLDEPTNHLDISYQLQALEALRASKKTVLAALHDLNLAAMFCTEIYLLKDRRVLCHGRPEEILTPLKIREVFDVKCEIQTCPQTGKIHVVYLPNSIPKEAYV